MDISCGFNKYRRYIRQTKVETLDYIVIEAASTIVEEKLI